MTIASLFCAFLRFFGAISSRKRHKMDTIAPMFVVFLGSLCTGSTGWLMPLLRQKKARFSVIDLEKRWYSVLKRGFSMGGLHSGRTRQHTCIDDCLVIDTAWLRKQKMLPGQHGQGCAITWRKWTEHDFVKRTERAYHINALLLEGDSPALLLSYQVEQVSPYGSKKQHNHTHQARLVTTPCNYGSVRWWFACPACSQRVRVLYINPKSGDLASMRPRCRTCLDLHYPSQMASYIERHKAYERHLLANYGLYWASHRYDYELKEHYLEMTPALWALRLKSVIDWNMHLLKRVIECDLMIYRTDLRNLKSLRREEDHRVYLEHMQEKARQLNTQRFVKVLFQCIEYERLVYEVNTSAMPERLFELYARLSDMRDERERVEPDLPQQEEEVEQKIISLEAMLKEVNQAVRKKAA